MRHLTWLVCLVGLVTAFEIFAGATVPHAADLLFTAIAIVFGFCAFLGIVYTVFATVLVCRFFAQRTSEPTSLPPVTIVKPLHGDEWGLLDNLATYCRQNYSGPIQFLFGVHDGADPALKVVEELKRLYPEAHITVVTDARLHGPNRKMSNIVNMMPHALHDVLVFADSDVSAEPDYLRHVIGELQKPDVGLVTCVYRGRPAPGLWPHLSALNINYHFLPSVMTGVALGLARPCFGQTIAIRRATLEKIGGFGQFANLLAEDNAIGEAVRKIGEKVAIPPFVVSHTCEEPTAAALAAHELRWSRTIRAVDPIGHIGSVVTHPLPLALLALLLSGGARWSWPIAAAALFARCTLKVFSDIAVREPRRDLWLLPLRDIASFTILIASFFSSHVVWRGTRFQVDRNGFLSPVQDK
ncbi:MAG TPA: bacteriohopanetetrol glucosamine biosynthesis glycosyltransferase HpnI [Trinickia sp.]|uniref:bacteriohopanetetrol glucosamine biosynthesis glycosyltransferase HpnI n=1 Tax=Trinickia sp. TaxID=2571163 RepID=UPI002BCB2834|nr:bacteriohopanetetrol glucosamine biosynthesis glycosyltransferase HpnI [Trinickia sp.]HTI19100.1 bacteriohopanetetrol glucosamine biosynthesis glycosyltransferase HpnI [Trinickia sp.]